MRARKFCKACAVLCYGGLVSTVSFAELESATERFNVFRTWQFEYKSLDGQAHKAEIGIPTASSCPKRIPDTIHDLYHPVLLRRVGIKEEAKKLSIGVLRSNLADIPFLFEENDLYRVNLSFMGVFDSKRPNELTGRIEHRLCDKATNSCKTFTEDTTAYAVDLPPSVETHLIKISYEGEDILKDGKTYRFPWKEIDKLTFGYYWPEGDSMMACSVVEDSDRQIYLKFHSSNYPELYANYFDDANNKLFMTLTRTSAHIVSKNPFQYVWEGESPTGEKFWQRFTKSAD